MDQQVADQEPGQVLLRDPPELGDVPRELRGIREQDAEGGADPVPVVAGCGVRAEQAPALGLGAMSRESSSFHHVPELAELGDRLTSRLGATKAGELTAAGAGFDLDAASGYARRQIDAARRDPRPGPRGARPGGLSRREIDVLRLVAAGRTSGEIATELFISTRTAEHHIQNIYTKIGVSNRAAATRWAVTHRVVDGVLDG